MGVSKVEIMENGTARTIMDLTGDTVSPEALAEGYTAHNATGEPIHGEMKTTTVLYTEQNLTTEQKAQARDNIGAASISYGVCETAADVADKVVTVDGSFILKEGAFIIVRFLNANSIAAPTLNVNGTGAKPMYRYGTTTMSTGTTTTGWVAGAIQMFTYNGEGWIRDYWNNTTYSNVSLGQGYTTCSTEAATTAKTASLSSYSLTTGGIVAVKFTNAVPANATLNINSKGAKAIYYNGAKIKDGVIKAGDVAVFIYSTYYRLISINRWHQDIVDLQENKADKATTLAGYGITDGATKTELNAVRSDVDNKQPAGNYALKDELDAERTAVEKAIAELKTQGVQQIPLFATDIEDCTDTTKVYVLPDGYIYGRIKKEIVPYTNQIPISVDTDGQQYVGTNGEIGYQTGGMLNMSTGTVTINSTYADTNTTGFIPIKKGDVLHFEDCDIKPGEDGLNKRGLVLYKTTFSLSTGIIPKSAGSYSYLVTFTSYDSGYIKTMTVVDKYNDGLAYVRFSAPNIQKAIITVNEEIVDPIYDYVWANTGHAFVPQDCEERIIPLEEDVENHESRIKSLEMYGSDSTSDDDIPPYIKTEADSVINRLIEKQGNRNFTIIGTSDFHYGGVGDNKDNLIRACKAISYISNRIHVDAIATLGDNLPYGGTYDNTIRANADRWSKEINEILAVTQKPGIVDFRTPGNHDRFGTTELYMPDNAIYSFISGYNRQCDYVDVPGGWGYRDFNGLNLRVIIMNTSETEGRGRFSTHSGYHMSTKQYKWLIDTLDMSGKPNASDWQILVMSHHKADDWQVPATNADTNNYILPNILHAYNTGGSYTGVSAEDGKTVSCNFAGKNGAKLIGQIHGHHHAYIYGKLYLCQGGAQTDVMAVSTPTSGFGTGSGHNDDNDGNYYDSVKDTAQETAFCVYSIDLDNHKIHAIHYGNGIDREISY